MAKIATEWVRALDGLRPVRRSQTLSDWFQKRKEDLAAAAVPADKSDCDEEEASEVDDSDDSVEERPLLGGCLVNPVTAGDAIACSSVMMCSR